MARDTLIGGALWEEYSSEVQRRMNDPVNMGEITQEEADKESKQLIIADFGAESCGDAVRLYWLIDPKNDVIVKSRFKSFGCGTAIASSDMMAELCMDKTVDEALKITNIDVEKALRDEGTSYHYLPPSDFSGIDKQLLEWLGPRLKSCSPPVEIGSTWTTDAPFRETASAIDACRNMGLLAVEMEAAALYAFAKARNKPVICFAHVTNRMAGIEGDFEKGAENGCRDSLRLVVAVARLWKDFTR